jgi:sugar lactone lactonase YvrE
MHKISLAVDCRDELGEATIWDPRAGALWWVDIYGSRIQRFVPATGEHKTWRAPEYVGCIGLRARGGLVVALANGFAFFDPARGAFEKIGDPEADIPETRFNDGKTDRFGRFWAGTMFEAEGQTPRPIAGLYHLDPDLSIHRALSGIGAANGLAWSPNGRIMYFTDSHTNHVFAFDCDPATGAVANRRVFVDFTVQRWVVDGSTVDADGNYWLTIPFAGKVQAYSPDGRLIRDIDMPVDIPTCLEFGGPNLDVLYVTSARLARLKQPRRNEAIAGGVFAIEGLGHVGLELPPFAG